MTSKCMLLARQDRLGCRHQTDRRVLGAIVRDLIGLGLHLGEIDHGRIVVLGVIAGQPHHDREHLVLFLRAEILAGDGRHIDDLGGCGRHSRHGRGDQCSTENSHRSPPYSTERDLFRPGFAPRSAKPYDEAYQRLRAGGKPVPTPPSSAGTGFFGIMLFAYSISTTWPSRSVTRRSMR